METFRRRRHSVACTWQREEYRSSGRREALHQPSRSQPQSGALRKQKISTSWDCTLFTCDGGDGRCAKRGGYKGKGTRVTASSATADTGHREEREQSVVTWHSRFSPDDSRCNLEYRSLYPAIQHGNSSTNTLLAITGAPWSNATAIKPVHVEQLIDLHPRDVMEVHRYLIVKNCEDESPDGGPLHR
ncbi:hypothetical protein B0H14DRAFT_2705172 [Mycena olivaceomarginata]|nr:hypothetical protein B0H14DRAFT_2705172 [Mycena olivaceomarginata]